MNTIEKIYDGRGNTFMPSKDQWKLHQAGWRIRSRRKTGMMWRIEWIDPTDGSVWNQGTALEIQKGRAKR